MRIRIRTSRRLLTLVVVVVLAFTLVQGGAKPASGQFEGPGNSQCDVPTPTTIDGNPSAVQIDVKPGNPRNPVNVESGGVIEIAICSDDPDGRGPDAPTFNAPDEVTVICNDTSLSSPPSSPSCRPRNVPSVVSPGIAPGTPTAGKNGDELSLHSCNSERDVNHDGTKDLVCHFYVDRMDLAPGDDIIILFGCCKTPEFGGANFINCEADCPRSDPTPPCPPEFCD